MVGMHIRTLRVRIKDKHASVLRKMAREVNTVWNYTNELSSRSILERRKWLTAYSIDPYLVGAVHTFDFIGSDTIHETAHHYVAKRDAARRRRLRWRRSRGSNRSLGWVPFKGRSVKYHGGQIVFAGHRFGLWDSYGLSNRQFRAGSFTEDARGRWYLCVAVSVSRDPSTGTKEVGIDLGLKTAATMSDGTRIDGRWYRELEPKLAKAQRARNKKRVAAIHAKISNRRKDRFHKTSSRLVTECKAIFVGDVAGMNQTRMAKSVYDAGWRSFKVMLEYKCQQAGVTYREIDEAFTTQTCSCCGEIPDSSPKGRAGLGIRDWVCDGCGAHHDRDVNAARNILRLGLGCGPPAEETAQAA